MTNTPSDLSTKVLAAIDEILDRRLEIVIDEDGPYLRNKDAIVRMLLEVIGSHANTPQSVVWSKEPPKEPGWYWVRHYDNSPFANRWTVRPQRFDGDYWHKEGDINPFWKPETMVEFGIEFGPVIKEPPAERIGSVK